MIDGTDAIILKILQSNARTSNAEIARQVGLAPSAVFERIRKLEERGVIEGYAARVNPRAVELPLLAYVFVRADEKPGAETTARRVAAIPEVLEVHDVAGEDCFLVKVRAADTDSLGRLLRERLGVDRDDHVDADDDRPRDRQGIRRASDRRARLAGCLRGARPCLSGRTRAPRGAPRGSPSLAAFAAVYVLWGSTYLGIRFSMETLPPFFTQGVRFFLAGVLLYAWARAPGRRPADPAGVGRRRGDGFSPLRLRHGRPRVGGEAHSLRRGRPRRCNRTDRRSC